MIIGVTGNYASGKDTFAEILKKRNFYHISFSDIIREELTKRNIKISRDNLIDMGNRMREKSGANVLSRIALSKVKDGENYVFTSIRNPEEVKLLQERADFVLVNVVADEKVRLQRIVQRNREEDPKTLKELRTKEKMEMSSNPNAQQLHTVKQMAKVIISNNSNLEKLEEKAEIFIADWLFKLQSERPDWDHYFMNIADAVKLRASCLSAKKGAIIVKNKQIISTGYNGTAKGIMHCNEGGCERCTLRHKGKIKSGEYDLKIPCTCAHAEENAIVQAAYNGISTSGSIMYTTFTPCNTCARMIINAGIKEVISKVNYPDDIGTKMLKKAGVLLRILN